MESDPNVSHFLKQTLYDGIQQLGSDVHEVVVGKSMLKSCKFSHQRYHAHIEAQKKKHTAGDVEEIGKQVRLEIEECKKKQRRLETDVARIKYNNLLHKCILLCSTYSSHHGDFTTFPTIRNV